LTAFTSNINLYTYTVGLDLRSVDVEIRKQSRAVRGAQVRSSKNQYSVVRGPVADKTTNRAYIRVERRWKNNVHSSLCLCHAAPAWLATPAISCRTKRDSSIASSTAAFARWRALRPFSAGVSLAVPW